MAEYLDEQLRRAVILVAVLNLAYFWIEFATALTIGSVALLADSADFLEDASVNLLILVALGWSATRRARVGILLSGVLLLPAIAFLWTLWQKVYAPVPPAAAPLGGFRCSLRQSFLRALACTVSLSQREHHQCRLSFGT